MDDAHEAEPEHSPYLRLPWPLVTAGLIGVLLLALAAGLLANRYLRPQVDVQPTTLLVSADPSRATINPSPVVTEAVSTIQAATTAAAPAPTSNSARDTGAELPTGMASAQSSPIPTDTPAPADRTPSVLGIGRQTPSPVATVDPALAVEVGSAYETYWRVRSQALLELNANQLPDVLDGDYLREFENKLETLRSDGRAIKTVVTLNYKVAWTTKEEAIIVDRVEDDSFYVVQGTEQPITDPSNDVLELQVRLKLIDYVWKVVESVSLN